MIHKLRLTQLEITLLVSSLIKKTINFKKKNGNFQILLVEKIGNLLIFSNLSIYVLVQLYFQIVY